MGETDEKENVPAGTPTAEIETEPKETEKLLNTDEKKVEIESPTNGKESPIEDELKPIEPATEKVNGDEVIEIPEENKKKQKEDGREVKPKKIPIGGIKMPGFFTRNKSKPSEKENDGAEGELLDNAGNEAKVDDDKGKDENASSPAQPAQPPSSRLNFQISLPSLPPLPKFKNPFAKKAAAPKDEETGDADAEAKPDAEDANTDKPADEKVEVKEEKPEKEPLTENAGENEQPPQASKKKLQLPKFPAINLSQLPNLIPKRLRSNNQQTEDVELGNGPNNKAGLASMETLDDSIKDNETNKDVTDKAVVLDDGLETVKLNESEKEKEAEKDGKVGQTELQKQPIIERIRNYSCSVDDMAIGGGILLFLLIVLIICIFTFTGNPALKEPQIRDGKFITAVTSCGPVEGVVEDSSYAFRGIPYAVPPVKNKRFKPAEPIEQVENCWNGTFKAHSSPQVGCWQLFANGKHDGVEDCLTLDVVTPYVRYENPLPVIVLIGADSLTGDSPNKLRPSARFARQHDVVFVRPNFRLGVLGFLALEELSKSVRPPTSGNYALTDLIAVLQWIKLNIYHFGGNPKAVTLLGHRAGATLVTALITSPKAKDLFERAWVTSGSAIFPGKPLADYQRSNALEFKPDCTSEDCLYTQDAEELVEAVPDTWRPALPDLPKSDEVPKHEWLVLDGEVLQTHPANVWNREPGSPPRLVIGTTAHESHTDKLFSLKQPWTPEVVRQHIQQSIIGDLDLTDEVLKRYNATYQGLVQIISDIRTVCPLLAFARAQQNVPFYVVTRTGGDLEIADVDADIQAILGRYEPKTYGHRRYTQSIQTLFYHYVAHGEFQQYQPRRNVLIIDQDALPNENYPNCDFWISKNIVPKYARID